jgi:hypothetical protein
MNRHDRKVGSDTRQSLSGIVAYLSMPAISCKFHSSRRYSKKQQRSGTECLARHSQRISPLTLSTGPLPVNNSIVGNKKPLAVNNVLARQDKYNTAKGGCQWQN